MNTFVPLYDIVIVSLQPWNTSIGSNCIDLAKEFSKNCRVLYVNRTTDRRTLFNEWLQSPSSIFSFKKKYSYSLTKSQNNIWVLNTGVVLESINLFSGFIYRFLLKRNTIRITKPILRAIQQLEFNTFILFNDNDFMQSYFLNEYLRPKIFIYYLRDYLIDQPYFKKNGKVLEASIIRKADYVFANSLHLQSYARQYNNLSFYIGQGISQVHRNSKYITSLPAEIIFTNLPIVGYVGNLVTERLDIELLEHAVEKRADLFWLFVGPMDKKFAKSKIHKMNNVFFTGLKKPEELPFYIEKITVCINPQKLNSLTIGNYPRKLDEYLLFGKPVIARRTESTSEFRDFIYEYENIEQFYFHLDKALSEENDSSIKQMRKDFAKNHTWDSCVKKIYSFLNNTTVNM